MVSVKSYIKRGDDFELIEKFSGRVPDPDYIEGAIEILVNGFAITDLNMWDYVDQLWEYIVDALAELLSSGSGSLMFPDQPIELVMRTLDKRNVEVHVTGRRPVKTKQAEFVAELCNAGEVFFTKMLEVNPVREQDDRRVLEKIGALRGFLRT